MEVPNLDTVLGIGLSVVGLGMAMISLPRAGRWEFRVARCCFILTAFIFFAKLAAWGMTEISYRRLSWVAAGGAAIAVCLTVALHWVNTRVEEPAAPVQTRIVNQPPLAVVDPPAQSGKLFSNKPMAYFVDILQSGNALQVRARIEPFFGTLITFKGRVITRIIMEISGNLLNTGITLDGGTLVLCQFPGSARNYLASLTAQEEVEITGTIKDLLVGPMLLITDCHIRAV